MSPPEHKAKHNFGHILSTVLGISHGICYSSHTHNFMKNRGWGIGQGDVFSPMIPWGHNIDVSIHHISVHGQWNKCHASYLFAIWVKAHDDVITWNSFLRYKPFMGESTSVWIPVTKASSTDLWCFLWCTHEQTVEQTMELQVIWDTMLVIWCHCYVLHYSRVKWGLCSKCPAARRFL